MRFTQHYSGNAVCAPSRCVLMTGKHAGHAHVRNNRQAKLPAEVLARYGSEFPGQEPIPEAEVTIAEVLKQKGYATAAIGKWGLGQFGTSGDPNRQGFDLFFGYNCQAHAHSYYPALLWRNGEKVFLGNNPPIPGHAGLAPGADPNDPASYAPFKGKDYSPDRMIDEALRFIQRNKDRPLFLYFPSTIPHVALQVPDEELKPYLGQWDETPFTSAGGGYTPHQTPRAAYAAMISRLDKDFGRIMAELKTLGLDENTLVMFSGDNGTTHLEQEVDYKFFDSVGPLRGLKGSLYEGGIRVPTIVRWPGKVPSSSTCREPAVSIDFYPTLVEAAGATMPKEQVADGKSLLPLLGDPSAKLAREAIYWHYPHYHHSRPSVAVRAGDWKLIEFFDTGERELYDLSDDLGESSTLVTAKPDQAARLAGLLQAWRHEVNAQMPQANPAYDPKRAGEWWNRRTVQPTEAPGFYAPAQIPSGE